MLNIVEVGMCKEDLLFEIEIDALATNKYI